MLDKRRRRLFFARIEESEREWAEPAALVTRHGLRAADYDAAALAEYEEEKRLGGGADLREVARFWVERRIAGADHVTVAKSVKELRQHKEGLALSARHCPGSAKMSQRGYWVKLQLAGLGVRIRVWIAGESHGTSS